MKSNVELYVKFRGKERLLRLHHDAGEWHAALLAPGEPDLCTDKCVDPAPRGVKLPNAELRDFDLRIEQPKGNVLSIETVRLMASRAVSIEEGWIGVSLTSVMADYHNDFIWQRRESQPEKVAKILAFDSGDQRSREHDDRDVER